MRRSCARPVASRARASRSAVSCWRSTHVRHGRGRSVAAASRRHAHSRAQPAPNRARTVAAVACRPCAAYSTAARGIDDDPVQPVSRTLRATSSVVNTLPRRCSDRRKARMDVRAVGIAQHRAVHDRSDGDHTTIAAACQRSWPASYGQWLARRQRRATHASHRSPCRCRTPAATPA